MQTFLPYPDFQQSAVCIDDSRLGKQRVECLQILKALSDPSYGWQNHPAVKMWRGHALALAAYGHEVCIAWRSRGFNDTCMEKIRVYITAEPWKIPCPLWFGNHDFHASHRSNLLRKDYTFYSKYGWTEPSTLEYVWPVK